MILADLEAFDPHSRPLASGERRFACPLCGEGKSRDSAHRSLSLNARSGAWFCHRCGEKGVLAERREDNTAFSRTNKRDGLRRAFQLPPVPLVRATTVAQQTMSVEAPQAPPLPVPDGARFDPFAAWETASPVAGTAGEAYLRSRGLSEPVCGAADVRFCRNWWGRGAVLFPLYSWMPREEASLVAVQGRLLRSGTGPKARTGGRKRDGVFASHFDLWRRVRHGAPLIVCEAPIDALSLAQAGFPALALCGKDGAPSWLPLRCAFERVALAFDADDAGDGGAEKLAPVLASMGAKPVRLRPEGDKDWNEMLLRLGPDALGDWLAGRLLV